MKRNGTYLGRAHVKVVGSGDRRMRGGDTDLRGVFVADGLVGKATVIVKHGDEFGFYRGVAIHQPSQFQPPPARQRRAPNKPDEQRGRGFDAWENNYRANGINRSRQIEWLQNKVLNNDQKGVEVYRTK